MSRPEEAGAYIRGYTVANDYGLHDFRDTDAGSMLRVKGSDTLCPLGPGLVEGWDFHGKRIETRVNGATVQSASTDEMIWDMHYLVADIAADDHPRARRRDPVGHARELPPGRSPATSSRWRSKDSATLRNAIVEGDVPIREDVGAQPSASEEVVSTAFGGDWEFRGIRPPRR